MNSPHPTFEYYRCPESLATPPPSQDLRSRAGYFRIEPELIVFGRTAQGTEVSDSPVKPSSAWNPELGAGYSLPFDPSEVISNLLFEQYASSNGASKDSNNWKKQAIRNAYYLVRPLLPVSVRKHFQRISLRGWQQIPFPQWPVDTTVDRLQRLFLRIALEQSNLEEIPFIWFWPEGLPACAIMTHDVEAPAGRDFCKTLMDLNDSFGIKSSFQVVPEERYDVPSDWLKLIASRGFEVNIHDLNHDGHLFDNRDEFLRRVARINSYGKQFGALGFRSGVLYRNQAWMNALEFEYDMSVPNVAHLDPQRGGCCSVMPYLNGNLVELPVTCTQDYSLFNILEEFSIDLWKTQIASIAKINGMASFIVHPDYVIDNRARDTYSQLLAHLGQLRRENKIWLPLPRDVARWWRDRSQMRLVRSPHGWTIEGPSSHRARLAFARKVGSEIVYQLPGAQESS